ncbi:YaaL family protein [Bacillaceae bacterium IKA-2]|nr:YaaL family protein [Bacillaceae bacterium IKA-2]
MLFKKKGKIRELEDQRLVSHIAMLKENLMIRTQLLKNSIDPSEEVIFKLKLTEAKYIFLLKEARVRNVSVGKSK